MRSEETAAHRHVTIIIDCEIAEEDAALILGELIQFARHNNYFRQSKYRVLLWKENEFSRATPVDIPASSIARHLEKIDAYGTVSGSWENFREIYTPHRKAGQVILITTANKVNLLEQTKTIRAKNLLILSPADGENAMKQMVNGILCLPYEAGNPG